MKGLIFFKRSKDGSISHCERQPELLASKAENTSFSMVAPTVWASAWSSLSVFTATRAMVRPGSFPCAHTTSTSVLFTWQAPTPKRHLRMGGCTRSAISHTPGTRNLEEIFKDPLQPAGYCTSLYRQPIVWITREFIFLEVSLSPHPLSSPFSALSGLFTTHQCSWWPGTGTNCELFHLFAFQKQRSVWVWGTMNTLQIAQLVWVKIEFSFIYSLGQPKRGKRKKKPNPNPKTAPGSWVARFTCNFLRDLGIHQSQNSSNLLEYEMYSRYS